MAFRARERTTAIAIVALFAHRGCDCRSKREDAHAGKVMPIASVERTIQDLGTPPSRCLSGPWDAEQRADWRARRAEEDAGTNAHVPLARLATLDDRKLFDEIFERITDKVVFGGIASLNHAELTIYLAYWLRAEVDNGGFHQFFFNSAGDCAAQTADTVRELEIPALTALYARVLAAFPDGRPPEDRTARWELLKRITSEGGRAWSAEDSEFYRIDTVRPAQRYARAHLAELDLPPR